MGQHSGLHCPGAYTAKTTTLHAEASSTARVIVSTDDANKMRSYVTDNADQSACASCMMQCLRCDACSRASVLACDAYVAYDACRHAMHTSAYGRRRDGRACIAGEAVLRETLTVHNCLRARAPAKRRNVAYDDCEHEMLHRRPANAVRCMHDAMYAMHTRSACDAKMAQPALHGICMRCMHTCKACEAKGCMCEHACCLHARGGG